MRTTCTPNQPYMTPQSTSCMLPRRHDPPNHTSSSMRRNLIALSRKMQEDKEKTKKKNKGNNACRGTSMEVDSFYEKLSKLNESSGLSLVFNFRETFLDLYVFHKEVTQRGGFSQVTKDLKWEEVASALNQKCNVSMSPIQLQKVYAGILHQYEQTYYYRTPGKALGPVTPGCLGEKRKHFNNATSLLDAFPRDSDSLAEKGKRTAGHCQESTGPPAPEQKQTVKTRSENKKLKKDPDAPRKSRTSYQMFYKLECERLRKIHGENSGNINIRNMAVDAWRQLSPHDKQPYVEASKKDKERFKSEMAAYKQHKNKQDTVPRLLPYMLNFGTSSAKGGDYYVTTFEPDSGELILADESLVKSTMKMLKNAAPNDPIFHIDWDEYKEPPDTTAERYA